MADLILYMKVLVIPWNRQNNFHDLLSPLQGGDGSCMKVPTAPWSRLTSFHALLSLSKGEGWKLYRIKRVILQ